jgi:hypothetical protein
MQARTLLPEPARAPRGIAGHPPTTHLEGHRAQQEAFMNERERVKVSDLKVDQHNLYREELFTDLKVASIRRLTPVKQDGSLDKTRGVIFVGQSQVMTPAGGLPVQARLDAQNLQQAVERFPGAIAAAIDRMMAELEELRRREASRIVTPQQTGKGIILP